MSTIFVDHNSYQRARQYHWHRGRSR